MTITITFNTIKDLPADRDMLEYDEDGYAEDDLFDNPSHALRNVHTGICDDYLLKNHLTECYGWTTNFAEGVSDEPIWLNTPEGIYAYDVRRVELHSFEEGKEDERHTVYRLDDGDGDYSTYGSYEEVMASSLMYSFGDVLNGN